MVFTDFYKCALTIVELYLLTILSFLDTSNQVHLAIRFHFDKINLALLVKILSVSTSGLFSQSCEAFISGHGLFFKTALDSILDVRNCQ